MAVTVAVRTHAISVNGIKRARAVVLPCCGENLNDKIVCEGWALDFRRYTAAYIAAEEAAERRGAGIWRGEFEPPWEWRRVHSGGLNSHGCHTNQKTGEHHRGSVPASRRAVRRCKGSFRSETTLARAALERSAPVHVAGGTASTRSGNKRYGQ